MGGALIVLVCPVCFPDHAVPHGVQGYTLSDRECKSLFEDLTDRSALMSWRVEYKCIPDLAMCVVVSPFSKMRRLNVVWCVWNAVRSGPKAVLTSWCSRAASQAWSSGTLWQVRALITGQFHPKSAARWREFTLNCRTRCIAHEASSATRTESAVREEGIFHE